MLMRNLKVRNTTLLKILKGNITTLWVTATFITVTHVGCTCTTDFTATRRCDVGQEQNGDSGVKLFL